LALECGALPPLLFVLQPNGQTKAAVKRRTPKAACGPSVLPPQFLSEKPVLALMAADCIPQSSLVPQSAAFFIDRGSSPLAKERKDCNLNEGTSAAVPEV
jgi:hypothetical protein